MKIQREKEKEEMWRGLMIVVTSERNRKGVWEKEDQEIKL